MKILKTILIILAVIIVGLSAYSFFLPEKVLVERSQEIKCAPETAFGLINDLKKWELWNPWDKYDPKMEKTWGATTEGVGATYSWKSKVRNVGNGSMTIKESSPTSHVAVGLNFMERGEAIANFKIDKTEQGCKVTWSMDCDMSKPIILGRLMSLMMDKMLGTDFASGLANMKDVAEKMPVAPAGKLMGIEETDVAEMNCMMMNTECDMKDVGKNLGELYGKIGENCKAKKLEITGHPMAMYPGFHPGDTKTKLTAVMCTTKPCKDKCEGMTCTTFPKSHVLVAHYSGPYEGLKMAYDGLMEYAKTNNKEIIGEPWEEYINDPMTEKDPSKLSTNIYFPIK